MNIPILIVNILTFMAFILHTFVGDKELKVNEPAEADGSFLKREKWTMARCGWHWISVDLLLASVGLALINFTDYFHNENTLLQILAVYFVGYAILWTLTIAVSKQFPKNYVKLGQWILFIVIATLIQLGIK